MTRKRSPFGRFLAKCAPPDENGCIRWLSSQNGKGYGRFHDGDRQVYAHRWSWENHHERKIPDGLVIDHLCRVRDCVNPAHLEVVTMSENLRRGALGDVNRARAALITHCPQGHEYTTENTRIEQSKGYSYRVCKACGRAKAARQRALRKAAC